ncbi:MAG: AsmA-like C-terminal domain-containing protein [Thermodesulfobacteriota bacterium]
MAMNRYSKIVRWTFGAAALVTVILVMFILIAPRLIDIESVRETLAATLSQKVGGELQFQQIRLSILPRPHVAVIDGRLSVPGTFQAAWKSLEVSARLLPLFIGKIDIGTVSVVHPEISLAVAPKAAEAVDGRQISISAIVAEKMSLLAAVAAAAGKDPVVIIKNGRLNLRDTDRFELVFSDMNGRMDMPPGRVQINLKTRTDFCEKIELQAEIDLETHGSRGRINLDRFRLQQLPPNLLTNLAPWIGESLVNLNLDFKADGANKVEVLAEGSLPQLTVLQGGKSATLRAVSFKVRAQQEDRRLAVFLTKCVLAHPGLSLTGKFLGDQKTGRLEMEVRAADVDLPSTRQTLLALAGETAAVKAVFDIVRDGRVADLSIRSRGDSFEELGKLENITLAGSLSQGNIMIPGIHLDAVEVNAQVKILKGVLTAEGIRARYDNTVVKDGGLRLGLAGKAAPFHLDIGLNADLVKVPPVLKQILKDRRVLREIDRLTVISGRAGGRLILGETLQDITATVKVADFTLAARVDPIPAALIIKGSDLLYSNGAMTIERLEGKLKSSRFNIGPVRLDWRLKPLVDIQAGSAELQLSEIHTSLSAFASLKSTLQNIASINGTVALSRLRVTGPLVEPAQWDFQADASARNVQVTSERLPAPLSVRRAGIKATPQMLTISEAETAMLDAVLTVSARLEEYREGLQTADLKFGGTVGAKANGWLQQRTKIPSHLVIHPPLIFSNAWLAWRRNGFAAFSGDLTIHNDLKVSTDVALEPGQIHIKKFVVQDKDSTAAFTFNLSKDKVDFGFKGDLHRTTLDKLLADNRALEGWIRGDLQLTYAIGRPWDTRFEGTLSAKDLVFLERLGIPLKAKSIAVAGIKGKFDIAADMVFEEDQAVKLTGQVDHSPQGIRFKAEMTSNGIVLDNLVKALANKTEKENGAAKDPFWEFPIEGDVKLDSAYVTYGQYTWRPLRADLSLKPDRIDIAVSEAVLCGISTPGTITFLPREIQVDLKPAALDQEIKPSVTCLLDKDAKVDGRFNLSGGISSRGYGRELQQALTGSLEYQTGKGRIYAGNTFRTIREILAVLNVTEIFRGKLPEVSKEGFGFNSMKARLMIRENTIVLEEGAIDGLTMTMAAKGVLNLTDLRVDMTVLVAPFKTVDAIVNMIPIVGNILGGSLISVPVSVKGDLQNPEVTILPPAAIGEGLLGIMKRTLELPVKVIQPLIPEQTK